MPTNLCRDAFGHIVAHTAAQSVFQDAVSTEGLFVKMITSIEVIDKRLGAIDKVPQLFGR